MDENKNLYLIEYQDASFSYQNFPNSQLKKMPEIKSVGWIIHQNDQVLDLGLIKESCNGKVICIKGILIPAKAVKKITRLL